MNRLLEIGSTFGAIALVIASIVNYHQANLIDDLQDRVCQLETECRDGSR